MSPFQFLNRSTDLAGGGDGNLICGPSVALASESLYNLKAPSIRLIHFARLCFFGYIRAQKYYSTY